MQLTQLDQPFAGFGHLDDLADPRYEPVEKRSATGVANAHPHDGRGWPSEHDLVGEVLVFEDLWGALTEPERLADWFGAVEGELSQGSEFSVHITVAGERRGQVAVCEPPYRLRLTMRDPDPQPGQPERTVIEVQLVAGGAGTGLVWEERGIPVNLLPAYGAGIQIHVEHLADYIGGREPRDAEARWNELLPAYQALGVS